MSGGAPRTRTPKEQGVWRSYMLLSEPRKIGVVALVTALVSAFLWFFVFSGSKSRASSAPTVAHSMTMAERHQLEDSIRAQVAAEYQSRIEDAYSAPTEEIDALYERIDTLEAQRSAGTASGSASETTREIARLRNEIEQMRQDSRDRAGQIRQEMHSEIDLVVSDKLREAEEGLVEKGADELLSWFCQLSQEILPWDGPPGASGVFSTARNAVNFYDQPCIGVASADDHPIAGKVYFSDNRNQARRVAMQAVQSLNSTLDWMRGRSVWGGAYSPSADDSCCRRTFFLPHPVFGVVYRLRVPFGPGDFREVCYRRRWLSRPLVKPLSAGANMTHLFHQSRLSKDVDEEEAIEEEEREEGAVSAEDKAEEQAEVDVEKEATEQADAQRRRALAEEAQSAGEGKPAAEGAEGKPKNWAKFVRSHVVAVLPYRARHIHRLPNLLKSFARVVGAKNSKDSPGVSAELVIVPVETEHVDLSDAGARLTAVVAKAKDALGIDVTLQPVSDATPQQMLTDLTTWAVGRRGTGQTTDDKDGDDDDNAGVNKDVKAAGQDVTTEERTQKAVQHLEQEVLDQHLAKLAEKVKEGKVSKKVQDRLNKWLKRNKQGSLADIVAKAAKAKASGEAGGSARRQLSDETMMDVLAASAAVRAYYTGLQAARGQNVNVVLLDSSLSNLPVTLARKATWRVVGGRQAYAPVAQANQVSSDDDDGQEFAAMLSHGALDRLEDGGVLEDKLPASSGVGSDEWWKQPPAGFDKSRRALQVSEAAPALRASAKASVVPGTRSLRVESAPRVRSLRRLEGEEDGGGGDDMMDMYLQDDTGLVDDREFEDDYGVLDEAGGDYGGGFADDFLEATNGKDGEGGEGGDGDQPSAGIDDFYGESSNFDYGPVAYDLAYEDTMNDGYDDLMDDADFDDYYGYYDPEQAFGTVDGEGDEATRTGAQTIDAKKLILGRLVPLYRRHTVLAGTKGDLAGALYRALMDARSKPPVPAEAATGEGEWKEGRVGDECVVTRMIFQLARRGYRIVRTVTPGLVVLDETSGRMLSGGSSPETQPCDCDGGAGGPHCRVWLPMTAVDDPRDEERVNCALTQIISAMGLRLPARLETDEAREQRKEVNEKYEKQQLAKKKAIAGAGRRLSPDVETRVRFSDVVLTTHSARFFDPSRGVEILAKLAARPDAAEETSAKDQKLKQFDGLPVEVFAFRFLLTSKAVVFQA